MEYNGLDEQALEEMIGRIEQDGLLRAPSYLGSEIMARIDRRERWQRRQRIRKRLQLVVYTLEVGVVTAAAVALIFLLPLGKGDGVRPARPPYAPVSCGQEQTDDGPAGRSSMEERQAVREDISSRVLSVTEHVVLWGRVLLPGE